MLNVDGSSLGNPGASGFGGVLRNFNGSWIGSFSGSVGFSNVLHVELLDLYDGFRIGCNKVLRTLVCYTDSTLALHLVQRETNIWHHYAAIIQNTKELLAKNQTIQLVHQLREGNAVVDCFAKHKASGSHVWLEFIEPPPQIIPLLQADASRELVAGR